MNLERRSKLIDDLRAELTAMLNNAVNEQESAEDATNALLGTQMFIRDIEGLCGAVTKSVKEVLAEIMEETGKDKIKVENGLVYMTEDTESVSYNSASIEVLCISDPEMAARLRPFRKVNTRKGGISIRA